jgi:hypothetical protein
MWHMHMLIPYTLRISTQLFFAKILDKILISVFSSGIYLLHFTPSKYSGTYYDSLQMNLTYTPYALLNY